MKHFRIALVLSLLLSFLVGFVYPLLVMGVAQVFFPHHANGSLIERNGKVIGSSLLGQEFSDPQYFWGRLSATTPPYNAAASGASNFSPANPKLLEAVNARVAALKQADPQNKARIPVDLVTASGSGLDPHISIAAAEYQAGRVARTRGMKEEIVKALIKKHTETAGFGLLGDAYVNVVNLNLALDEDSEKKK
jgi:K+-transporting ATPase ATPase C chain